MKRILVMLVVACGTVLPTDLWAQTFDSELVDKQQRRGAGLTRVRINSKYGFIRADGNLVITPQFDWAGIFSTNGLAAVRLNGKWGYIRTDGRFAIPPTFAFASGFSENGLAAVEFNSGKWGYIHSDGHTAIEPRFAKASPFADNGLASVEIAGKTGYIRSDGKFSIPPTFYFGASFEKNGLALVKPDKSSPGGYIRSDGTFAIPPLPPNSEIVLYDFADCGLARFNEGHWIRYIRSDGSVIQQRFEEGHTCSEMGLTPVKQYGKWGYIRTDGTFAIAPTYQKASGFSSNGLANVKLNGQEGYIRTDGSFAIPPQFSIGFYMDDANGIAEVTLEDGRNGYVNSGGKVLLITEALACPGSSTRIEIAKNEDRLIWPLDTQRACLAEIKKHGEKKQQRADEAARTLKELIAFRKMLKPESETNCGPVLEVKGSLVKVYFPVANYGNEHWIKRDQLLQPDEGCRFVNGRYRPD